MAIKIEKESKIESKKLLQTVNPEVQKQTRKWKSGLIWAIAFISLSFIAGLIAACFLGVTNRTTNINDELVTNVDYANYEQSDDDDEYFYDEYPSLEEHIGGPSSKIADIKDVSC